MKAKASVVLTILVVCAFVIGFWTPQASGQAVFGSVFGTVTDPSGAAVPNAKVTVTSATKGTSYEATTNSDGNYSVTHLIPDTYNVKAEAPGFKAFEAKSIPVSADAAARVDGQFQVGGSTETVEVTSEAPQLKTDRADVAVELNNKYVQDLPVLNRNFTTFELLSPGTQELTSFSHAATENPQGGRQIFVDGQHFSGTAFELDGTDNQDPILGIIVVNPNLDAIQETKMTLQNYDAEFGKAVAGVVSTQTKSGTNDFHGSAFWFRRTDATQARDPFKQFAPDPLTGRFIPPTHWNQFGGTIGGPIIKNKLFFFGDYQGTRETNGITQKLTIPTAQVLTSCLTTSFCDLGQYQPLIGNGIAGDPKNYLYDPNTGNPDGSGRLAFCGDTEVLNPTPANCPNPFLIPTAAIPGVASFVSPQTLNILPLFQKLAAIPNLVQNNFVAAGSGPYKQNSFDTRIDLNASPTLQVFGRFSLDYFNLTGTPSMGALGGVGFGGFGPAAGLAGSSTVHNYSLAAGFTKTVSASLLTDFRFGYFKYNPQTKKWDQGTAPMTGFNIPDMNLPNDIPTSGLAGFFFESSSGGNGNGGKGTMSDFGDGLNINRCNCPLTESEQQFQFVNNWTKIRGNHQFKFGGDVRYAMNLRVPSDANRTGQLNFNALGTSNSGNGGLDLVTFLLGEVTAFERYVSTSLDAAERQKRMFYYGQDTWRITPKFTLNYGLRWEIYFPESVNGRLKGGFANLDQGVVRVAGVAGFGTNGNVGNNWHAFAPRLGVAYQVTPKTVLRLGYGRSYDIGVFGSNFGHTVTQNLPVLIKQNVQSAVKADVVPVFNLTSGPGLVTFPPVPSNGKFPLEGPTCFLLDHTNCVQANNRPSSQRLPTLDAWNVTVQHQLTNTLSVEAAYVGNRGTNVFAGNGPGYDPNQPTIVGCAGPGCTTGVPQVQRRPFYNKFSYPGFIDPTTGGTLMCCSDSLNYLGNNASSNYNALQVKVDKRFTHGLQFLAHYTYSHANNYDSTYYPDNPHIAYGPVDFSRNHVFVANVVYELPFGRGKAFVGNASRAEDLIIGGWELTSTSNWSSGLPWTPSTAECGNEEDVGVCRPNKGSGSFHVGASKFDPTTHTATFFTPLSSLTGPFSDPGIGVLGNIGRNSFRGPRFFTSDLSVAKNFGITERVKAQFRMDAFNVFNHPVLAFDGAQSGGLCIDCSGTNGKITALEFGTTMRELQFALRFNF
jgi:outer membrane receptor protein involved in Fe transport